LSSAFENFYSKNGKISRFFISKIFFVTFIFRFSQKRLSLQGKNGQKSRPPGVPAVLSFIYF